MLLNAIIVTKYIQTTDTFYVYLELVLSWCYQFQRERLVCYQQTSHIYSQSPNLTLLQFLKNCGS